MSGHGHVTPNPDGSKARCGGPAICGECAREAAQAGQPVRTGLSAAQNCEDWNVFPDTRPGDAERNETEGLVYFTRLERHRSGFDLPVARLRRIGWLDQRGQVWLRSSDWMKAGGPNGSITPLLIDPGERDGS